MVWSVYDVAFLFRLLATLIMFTLLRRFRLPYNFVLPFVLFELDGVDSLIATEVKGYCYKIYDKISDLMSYLLVAVFFQVDKEYLYYMLYRGIGVLGFGMSRNTWWLVACPDMMKEYLFYKSVFSDMSAFPVIVPVKMVLEYHHHFIHDPMTQCDPR